MATLSFSTAFIADVMDRLSRNTQPSDFYSTVGPRSAYPGTLEGGISNNAWAFNNVPYGSLFSSYNSTSGGNQNISGDGAPTDRVIGLTASSGSFNFRNAAGTTLTSWLASQLTRSIDSEGYAVMSNFPAKIPAVAGTVSDIQIVTLNTNRSIILTVGAPGSGADVEFADRTLVTSQPWRLDGSIKFRVPISYTYST